DVRVERHVKVVVEVAAKRREPANAPSLFRLVRLEHGQRSPGHQHERRVALLEKRQIAQCVYPAGTARASVCVPRGVEHEVIDDQLAPTIEELLESLLAVRAVEGIG